MLFWMESWNRKQMDKNYRNLNKLWTLVSNSVDIGSLIVKIVPN